MRDGSRTKTRLTRVALELFVRQGVAETTIKHIAAAAKLSEGALYRHYPSKDELAWQLFATHFTGLARELDAIQGQHPTTRAKLEAMIRHFCRFFDRDPTLFTYLLVTQHGQLKRVTADMPNPTEVVRRVIADGMRRRDVPKVDPEVATLIVMGIVLQVAVGRMYGRIASDLEPLAGRLVAAAWGALRG
jgi:AcrR family transcriptional regulator